MDKVVLEALEERGSIETFEFAKELGKDHQSIVGSVKSVHALGDVSDLVPCLPELKLCIQKLSSFLEQLQNAGLHRAKLVGNLKNG